MTKQSVNTGSIAEQYASRAGIDASEHIDKPNAVQKVEEAAVKHVQEVEEERAKERATAKQGPSEAEKVAALESADSTKPTAEEVEKLAVPDADTADAKLPTTSAKAKKAPAKKTAVKKK